MAADEYNRVRRRGAGTGRSTARRLGDRLIQHYAPIASVGRNPHKFPRLRQIKFSAGAPAESIHIPLLRKCRVRKIPLASRSRQKKESANILAKDRRNRLVVRRDAEPVVV